ARTTLSISGPATPFRLAVRQPGWAAGKVTASLNGQSIRLTDAGQHWLSLARQWQNGDRLDIALPEDFRLVPLDTQAGFPTAVAYGPVVLAFRSERGNPAAKIDFKNLADNFVPSPGEALTWHLKQDPSVLVRPLYAFKEGEEYFVYLDPTLPTRISHRKVSFSGQWQEGSIFRYSNVPGASCEASFEGTRVRWLGFKFDDAGRAEVRID